MDIEEIRADCVKGCKELIEVCYIGDRSFYTCQEEHVRCLSHCVAMAREESDA